VKLFRRNTFKAAAILVALFVFTGDLGADAVADLRGDHCVSESSQPAPSHEKAPCSHCSCAVHTGAVVISDALRFVADVQSSSLFLETNVPAPSRLASTIDHPPQLI
jgi:hypothetical protein